jgi:hypothetical protein
MSDSGATSTTSLARALGDAALRFTSADARQSLEQLRSAAALAEGKVCLIGLDAIRERMGARWPGRREMVYAHVEQLLERRLGPHGFHARLSETDYVVAQPDVTALAAQAFCLNCLREILRHFVGEARMTDIVVRQVTSIDEVQVDARRLDVARVEAEDNAERARRISSRGAVITSQDHWTPFVAQDGRTLRASCQLEPVFQLKTYARIGYRMTRRVLQMPEDRPLSVAEQRQLTGADIERIDFATLARGLNRLQQEPAGDRAPSLILPVSFATLSSQRGRAILAEFFRAAKANVQRGLICEVCDIEGVPPSAMLAATSLIRPFCLFVVGRLTTPPAGSLESFKDSGLHGFSFECPAKPLAEDEFVALAKTVVAAARPVARAVMFFQVASPRQAAFAGLFGVTHASFAPAGAPRADPSEILELA